MALAANIGSNFAAKFGQIQAYPVALGVTIYRGATVVIHGAGDSEGYAGPATDDTADTLKQIVVGIAEEKKDNSASAVNGQDSDGKTITVRVRQDGKVKRKFPSNLPACVGKLACVKDDETVQLYVDGTECNTVVGRITEQSGSQNVFVNFDDRPMRLATGLND